MKRHYYAMVQGSDASQDLVRFPTAHERDLFCQASLKCLCPYVPITYRQATCYVNRDTLSNKFGDWVDDIADLFELGCVRVEYLY